MGRKAKEKTIVMRIPESIYHEIKKRVDEHRLTLVPNIQQKPKYAERDKIEVMKLPRVNKMRLNEKYGSIEAALEAGVRAEIRDGKRIMFTV